MLFFFRLYFSLFLWCTRQIKTNNSHNPLFHSRGNKNSLISARVFITRSVLRYWNKSEHLKKKRKCNGSNTTQTQPWVTSHYMFQGRFCFTSAGHQELCFFFTCLFPPLPIFLPLADRWCFWEWCYGWGVFYEKTRYLGDNCIFFHDFLLSFPFPYLVVPIAALTLSFHPASLQSLPWSSSSPFLPCYSLFLSTNLISISLPQIQPLSFFSFRFLSLQTF